MTTLISIVILTKNEATFIERCIRSVSWADEVVVLDSGSNDSTKQIAVSLGAKVYHQDWLGWSGQRTKAISLAANDWVFCVECDEIVTPELAASIQAAMQGRLNNHNGYSVDRRGDFLGILLPNESRRSKQQNFVRLFNRQYSAYDPAMKVHEEVRVPGRTILLSGLLLHWRGYVMDEYIPVFNRYATVEAEVLNEQGIRSSSVRIFARPVLRFLWCYIYKQGFRLGTRGLIHAMLKATSEYIRYAKLWEMQSGQQMLHPSEHIYDPTLVTATRLQQDTADTFAEIK